MQTCLVQYCFVFLPGLRGSLSQLLRALTSASLNEGLKRLMEKVVVSVVGMKGWRG